MFSPDLSYRVFMHAGLHGCHNIHYSDDMTMKLTIRIGDLLAKTGTRDLLNAKQKCQLLQSNDLSHSYLFIYGLFNVASRSLVILEQVNWS
jgi:hypothetical protein